MQSAYYEKGGAGDLRDASGQIVINEEEALADIANIQKAIEAISNAIEQCSLSGMSGELSGGAFEAYSTSNLELIRELKAIQSHMQRCIERIRAVLKAFQRTDRELADTIRRTMA